MMPLPCPLARRKDFGRVKADIACCITRCAEF
jgi:hypothetical protein